MEWTTFIQMVILMLLATLCITLVITTAKGGQGK